LADSQQKPVATSFFSALLDSVSQAIVAESVDGIILYCNPAAEAVLGYAASDMVGLPFSRILPDPELNTQKNLTGKTRPGAVAKQLPNAMLQQPKSSAGRDGDRDADAES